jgi:hypothetical protein
MSEDIFYFFVCFHGVERKYFDGRDSGCPTQGRRGFKCRPMVRTHGLYRLNLTVPSFTNTVYVQIMQHWLKSNNKIRDNSHGFTSASLHGSKETR